MNILIIRFSSLGDVILTTPCVALLKQSYPNAKIFFVTKQIYSDLLKDHKSIDHVLSISKEESVFSFTKRVRSNKKFDLVVDLHNSLKSRFFCFLLKSRFQKLVYKKPYFKRWLLVFFKVNLLPKNESVALRYMKILEPLGIIPKVIYPFLPKPPPIEPSKWNIPSHQVFAIKKKKIIAVAPGSQWYTKMWPIDRFIEVTKIILADKKEETIFIFLGGIEEKYLVKRIKEELGHEFGKRILNLIGTLSLLETCYILSYSKVLLCNDSGLMHMASALQVKILPLFLSTVPEFGFLPMELNLDEIISYPLSCKPCDHKGLNRCPKKHFQCAHLIKSEEVSRRLKELLL